MKILGLSHTDLRESISELTKKPISKTVAANWFYRAARDNKPVPSFVTIFLLLTLELKGLRDVFHENVEAGMADA